MNSKTKRRMVVVAGVIVIVIIVLFAVAGGSSSATVTSVADAASGSYVDKKVQVTGTVVDNSYSLDQNGVLTFEIYDPDGDPSKTLNVSYDKGVAATFGNGVTAICTGRMDSSGLLTCTELVTKCPSKYESATTALTVDQLLGYGSSMYGKTTKVSGSIASGTLADATKTVRFVLTDGTTTLPVNFGGALPDTVKEGSSVVVTGSLSDDGTSFLATDVSLEG